MQNDLEYALSNNRWGDAARILESLNGATVIADTFARKALAELLRKHDKKSRGKPRKILPNHIFNLEEQIIMAEYGDLLGKGWPKEAAKAEIGRKHCISRGIVEQLEAKYRNIPE